MNISDEDLQTIVTNIWATQLGLQLDSGDFSLSALFDHSGKRIMTASIQISGSWRGAVHVYCSRSLLEDAAATMFSSSPEELSADDVRDTLGEITNMTAGNVKALLPGECFISLPVVVDGTDYDVTLISTESIASSSFELAGERMIVAVLRHLK